jgi:hypothetical protein
MQSSRFGNRLLRALALAVALALTLLLPVQAGSTVKTLSTNFTLVNLGPDEVHGEVQYLKPDGSAWRTSQSFTLPAPGGQLVFRQYADSELPTGKGSVIVNADGPLGAVAQIQARNQTPTSGAYVGFPEGSDTFYVPLVARQRSTASGLANSQIVIQNTGSAAATVTVDLIDWFTGSLVYSKTGVSVNPGASFLYDLADEGNLPTNWIGSAKVKAPGGQVAVVANFFMGPNGMQTFNGFPASRAGRSWVVPLFVSRLGNGLSAPVTVQNVSNEVIPVGGVVMTCKVDATSPSQTPATFVVSNTVPISPSMSYAWNPVTDMSLPSNWLGSCRIETSADTVAFVQLRFMGTDKTAAYEALSANSTDKTVVVPLVAKRLPNGFATAVTIQNLSTTNPANVALTYTPGAESASQTSLTLNRSILPGGSLIQNHRVDSSHPQGVALPDGWQGTLTVTSDQPIAAFVQLDFLGYPGDPYMAHVAFTRP